MKPIAPLAALLVLAGLAPAAAANELVRQDFGYYRVICTEDAMTSARSCQLTTIAAGPGPFGDTRLTVAVLSSHKNQSSLAFNERSMGWRVTTIAVRFDGAQSQPVVCAQISGDNCYFTGPLRTTLLSGLESSRTMRVRLTILNGNAYDFTFDLTDYRNAERAFLAAQSRYLP
jgi:hypothetical protein